MNPTFMVRQAVMQGDATNKAGGWLVVVFVLQKKEWGEAHVWPDPEIWKKQDFMEN